MKKRCMPVAAMLLLVSHFVFAIEPDPIIVTATRTTQTADETLSSVTVITRELIERQQARSVRDLLLGVAGISLDNSGGPGKMTSVFLRGTESDHVLVLIDGVKAGSATLGTAAFQDIPVEQIERIEIVRGPRSSLYGSEAIGGVIQIFTRKGGGALKPFFTVGGGSYHTYNASAGLSGSSERSWFNLSVSGSDTEGFNACTGDPLSGGGCFTIEPDQDGYRNLSGSLRAGHHFDNGMDVDVHVLRAEGKSEFDGSDVNESETALQVIGGTLYIMPVDIWQMVLVAGRSHDQSDNLMDGTFKTRFNTQRDTVSFQNDLTLATDQLLTIGADYQDDYVDSTTAYTVTSRNITGLFGQYQGSSSAHDVQLSVRRDNNQQFGEHKTGSAAWGYALGKNLRLTASCGTAFKAPTFNELYFPGFGNPDLRSETSRSVEFGLSNESARRRWSLNAYETRIDDLIAFDSITFAAANIDQARIHGLEAVLNTQFDNWVLNANVTLLNPENRSGSADDGNTLPRRARQSLRLDADGSFGRYRLGATLFAAGKRYDDLANSRELGGYATLDMRVEYSLARDWRLQGRIENLFDKSYETAAFFNQPGRSLYMTLRYQP